MIRRNAPARSLLLVTLGVALLAGCVERVRELTAAERAQLREYVGTRRPRPQHPLAIRFGDSVELVGYDVSTDVWAPGSRVRFTWYWHAVTDVDDGFKAFTHVGDASGQNRFGADDEGLVRQIYPVGRFRRGEYVRDVQDISLPASFAADVASVFLGVYRPSDGERMTVTRGQNDSDDRARIVDLPTRRPGPARPAAPTVPRLRVVRVETAPSIDGRLAEPEWQNAVATPAFVNTLDGSELAFAVTVRALWDDSHLYVAFEVEDTFLVSPFRNHDDHLWEKDCVELMIDPGGDARNYFELQANPVGTTFDTRYDSPRNPQPFGHVDWDSRMRSAIVANGTANDNTDDRGYVAELSIPFTSFAAGEPPAPGPTAGTIWRANFYVMDAMREGMRYAAWSPPRVGDFHVPGRFGELVFEGTP